jgi:transcriptional regulator with XRE-family HTH domain
MSHFGKLLKRLRTERGLSLHAVADKIGSHKGYVSGIETGKVNPPSVNLCRKLARLLGQDEREMVLLAWIDKAPALIRDQVNQLLPRVAKDAGSAPRPREST